MMSSEELMPTTAMSAGRIVKPGVTEALEQEKKALQERLADIEEALTVLREYPDIQKVIDTLAKHTRF